MCTRIPVARLLLCGALLVSDAAAQLGVAAKQPGAAPTPGPGTFPPGPSAAPGPRPQPGGGHGPGFGPGGGHPTDERLVVPHLRIGVSSSAVQVLDPKTLDTVGRVDFDPIELLVNDVDALVTGGLGLVLTRKVSRSAVRAIRLADGGDAGEVETDFTEFALEGVDPFVAGGRAVFVLLRGTGTGVIRSVELADPIVAGPGSMFDLQEYPVCDVDPLLTPDGTTIVLPTDSGVGTGNIRIIDAATLQTTHVFPLQPLQERPITGLDPQLAADETTVLVPLWDPIQARGRLRFVDLGALTSNVVDLDALKYPMLDVDVALTPDGQRAFWLVGNSFGPAELAVFDVPTRSLLFELPFTLDEYPVRAIDPLLTPDGGKLVVVTHAGAQGAGRMRIVDTATLSVDHDIVLPTNDVSVVEVDPLITPDGTKVVWETYYAPISGRVRIIDIATGAVLHEVPFDLDEVPVEGCDLLFDATASRVIVTSMNSAAASTVLRIVDLSDGSVVRVDFPVNEHPVPHIDPVLMGTQNVLVVNNDSATAQMVLRKIDLDSGLQVAERTLPFGEASREAVDVVASWLADEGDSDAVLCSSSPPFTGTWPEPPPPPLHDLQFSDP